MVLTRLSKLHFLRLLGFQYWVVILLYYCQANKIVLVNPSMIFWSPSSITVQFHWQLHNSLQKSSMELQLCKVWNQPPSKPLVNMVKTVLKSLNEETMSRVYLVFNRYFDVSLKGETRDRRESSFKVSVKKNSPIFRNWGTFLKERSNKDSTNFFQRKQRLLEVMAKPSSLQRKRQYLSIQLTFHHATTKDLTRECFCT